MATAPAHLLLILDTETTGLDRAEHGVIEIAAILYSVEHHCVLQQISTLIPSDRSDNPAEAINQIPIAAANATPAELSQYFCQIIGYWGEIAEYVVAHNAEFDRKWFKDHPILASLYDQHWLCSCHDFTWPHQHKSGQKLIDLALAHGIGVSSAHRALTDCQLLAALFDRTEDLAERVAAAASPKVQVRADVSYGDRQLAKDAGFRWDGAARQWVGRMSESELKQLPFPYTILETADPSRDVPARSSAQQNSDGRSNRPRPTSDSSSRTPRSSKSRPSSETKPLSAVEDPMDEPDVVPF